MGETSGINNDVNFHLFVKILLDNCVGRFK